MINKWLGERTKFDKAVIKIMVLIFFYFLISANISCLGTKSISEKTSEIKETDKTEITNDTTESKEVNKEIEDKAEIKVQESNSGNKNLDSIVNKRVDAILSAINIKKSSGDNSYKLYYDLLARTVRMEATIGATQSTAKEEVKETVTEKSFEQQTDEYFKKKITALPWWAYIILAMLAWPYIKPIVMMFLGPTNLLVGARKIFKDDNKV